MRFSPEFKAASSEEYYLSFPRRRESSPKESHRDDTHRLLRYKQLSAVLMEPFIGLDSRLRGNDNSKAELQGVKLSIGNDNSRANFQGVKQTILLQLLLLIILLGSLSPLFARNPNEPVYYAAPTVLPNVLPEMNSAGFWISRHPYPDSLIMTSDEIARFNAQVNKQGTVTKIWQHSSRIAGNTIQKQINESLSTVFTRGRFDETGAETSDSLKNTIRANAAVANIPNNIHVRFGFPIAVARQRLAPSFANLNNAVLDLEFDELQNSGENIGTPLVFYHDSADGQWIYGASATSSGWFLRSEICFVDQKDWLKYQNAKLKAICLSARADIWKDVQGTQFQAFCRMGTAFPILADAGEYFRIQIPVQDRLGVAYIAKEDVSSGFLPYTPRNVYKQAFKMLNVPYGWGDMNADWDCSSLLKNIFSSFGIYLPRNGLSQAKAAKPAHEFTASNNVSIRDSIIADKAVGAISFLRLEGHIMLYLGSYKDRSYALHDIWSYRSPGADDKDDVYAIKKMVVSDLSLGTGSKRGSLLERITMISIVK